MCRVATSKKCRGVFSKSEIFIHWVKNNNNGCVLIENYSKGELIEQLLYVLTVIPQLHCPFQAFVVRTVLVSSSLDTREMV